MQTAACLKLKETQVEILKTYFVRGLEKFLFLKFHLFIYLYPRVWIVCLHGCACCPQILEDDIESSGAAVTDSCRLPCGCGKLHPGI